MAFQNTLVEDCFGRMYLVGLASARTGHSSNSATPLAFDDRLSAERFLRCFDYESRVWRQLHSYLSHKTLAITPIIADLADQLILGRLVFFRLPDDYKERQLMPPPSIQLAGSQDYVYIASAAELMLEDRGVAHAIADRKEAEDLIEALALSDRELSNLAAACDSPSSVASGSDSLSKRVVDGLMSKALVMCNTGPKRVPMAIDPSPVLEGVTPAQIPLAPETENWLEIKLADEDGEPVCEQDYCITDSSGAQHKGKTDARGGARIEKIAGGECEIAFPQLESWS